MTTPQSTKKKLEETREYLYATYYGLIIQEIWARGGNEMTTKEKEFCEQLTQKTWDKLLTILKETCEAVIGEDEPEKTMAWRRTGAKYNGPNPQTQGWNNAIDQTKANLNNLLGGDDNDLL